MASLASSGRNAQHRLVADSGSRRLRHFASAVVSSVSSQFSSNGSVVGLEDEQHHLQGKKMDSGGVEGVSSPFAGPSSSSSSGGDGNSQSITEPAAPCLDNYCCFYSDVATGGSERRLSWRPSIASWMSVSTMEDRGNPLFRNSPPNETSLSSSVGPQQQCVQSSRKFGLQYESEIEICQGRLHVKDISRAPIWQWGQFYHQHGIWDDRYEKITHDRRNSPPRRSQFNGSRLFSSGCESRQYMQSSRGFALRQEHESETYQGRRYVEELSRVRIWYNPRRSHMGHAHHDDRGGRHDKSAKASERILGWGLWSDMGLAIGKGSAGYMSGSTALIADAAHSVSDIALSGVALWTSRVAHAPKDKQHPYGHGKFESVGALGISGMLLLTGGGIAWHAFESLQPFIPMMSEWVQTTTGHSHDHVDGGGHHHGIDLQHPYVALTAAVVSIGVKETLYQRTRVIGEAMHSELLKASAWHHRSDAVSSIVALLGIGGAILGMPLLDPVAGIVVSGMIMKAGFETGYQSLQDLVDSGVPESVLSPIRKTVLEVEGVEGCHHLRGRKMGSYIHVDAHIEVDPWLSVSAAHNIAEAVRHHVHRKNPEVTEAFVHIVSYLKGIHTIMEDLSSILVGGFCHIFNCNPNSLEPADGGTKTLTHQEAEIEHELHDDKGDFHKHPDNNGYSFNKKDLTNLGSKADLMKSSHTEACVDDGFEMEMRQHSVIEQDVRNVVGASFHEKMSISQVTSHFVQGKVVVEVEVSMSPEMSVRVAMDYADEAQRAILERVSDISTVRVQLKLSTSSPQNL